MEDVADGIEDDVSANDQIGRGIKYYPYNVFV